MAQTQLLYSTKANLCCGSLPANVILCVDPTKAADSRNGSASPEDGQSAFIEASITAKAKIKSSCDGSCSFKYTLSYDTTSLAEGVDELVSSDITGIFCRDCHVQYLEWFSQQ